MGDLRALAPPYDVVTALLQAAEFLTDHGECGAACDILECIERMPHSDSERAALHVAALRIGESAEAQERRQAPHTAHSHVAAANVLQFPSGMVGHG